VQFLREISDRRKFPAAYDLVIHPGAMAKNRFWPATKYPALVEALPSDWKIGVLGLPEDVAALKPLLPVARGIDYRVGTLKESLQTLASARLLLVMDSGNVHFAEVLGVPAVAIFGKEDPRSILAAGTVDPVYVKSAACQPCGLAVCSQKEIFCLTNIDPLQVAKRLIDHYPKSDSGSGYIQARVKLATT
jgi:ADP-heptose:LPS heptosyltransferase